MISEGIRMNRIYVINGPNLNLIEARESEQYGSESWTEIESKLENLANDNSIQIEFFQSNHEGYIIDYIHKIYEKECTEPYIRDCTNLKIHKDCGIILNAGALSHTSYAIYDAIKMVNIPTIEVHMSNIYAREEFRRQSVISAACMGQISGFKGDSYILAFRAFVDYWNS